MLLALLLLLQDSPVERYLAEKDGATRAKILPEIKGTVAEVAEEIRKGPKRGPATTRGDFVRKKLTAEHPLAVGFEYLLWVPPDYAPEKKWRLLVSLHGQSGDGEQQSRAWIEEFKKAGDTFLLCPSAGRGGWGRSLLGHAYILNALRDVMAQYAIDPDLVFLDGASMGGNGSFEFACLYPDRLAAVAPRAGGPMFKKADKSVVAENLENLLSTPVYWLVGAKDEKVPIDWVRAAKAQLEALKIDLTYREIADGGHEWFPKENARVFDWMRSKRREPYPKRAAVYTHERIFARNFWLEVAEFRGKEIVKRGFKDLDGKQIEERLAFADEIQARAEIEGNEIRVTATGAKELRIWLHEKMVDFSRPVTVIVNGQKATFTVKPSVETLLESARRDRGLLYTAVVKVKAP